MRFICSWYDMDREIKQDIVEAKDTDEASAKVHMLYPAGQQPAPGLAIYPLNGYHDTKTEVSSRW